MKNMFWGKGFFRITTSLPWGEEETHWFFNPQSGAKGGLVTFLVLVFLVGFFALIFKVIL